MPNLNPVKARAMNITMKMINEVLKEQDVEGLIAAGASEYEYAAEAEVIALALSFLDEPELTPENVHDILVEVWAESFDMEEEDMAHKEPLLQKTSAAILEMLKTAAA